MAFRSGRPHLFLRLACEAAVKISTHVEKPPRFDVFSCRKIAAASCLAWRHACRCQGFGLACDCQAWVRIRIFPAPSGFSAGSLSRRMPSHVFMRRWVQRFWGSRPCQSHVCRNGINYNPGHGHFGPTGIYVHDVQTLRGPCILGVFA